MGKSPISTGAIFNSYVKLPESMWIPGLAFANKHGKQYPGGDVQPISITSMRMSDPHSTSQNEGEVHMQSWMRVILIMDVWWITSRIGKTLFMDTLWSINTSMERSTIFNG